MLEAPLQKAVGHMPEVKTLIKERFSEPYFRQYPSSKALGKCLRAPFCGMKGAHGEAHVELGRESTFQV